MSHVGITRRAKLRRLQAWCSNWGGDVLSRSLQLSPPETQRSRRRGAGHARDTARHYFEIREDEAVIFLDLPDDVLLVNRGGVMLWYRNIWDGTEIAKA